MTDLSADVLLAAAWTDKTRQRLEGDPRFPTLPATQNGTVIFSDLAMANAATFPAPGALVYLLDKAVPILKASAPEQDRSVGTSSPSRLTEVSE